MTDILTKIVHKLVLILGMIVVTLAFGQEKEQFKREFFVVNGDSLNYRILYPEHFSESESYPLVLFLHGAGERGSDNEKQLIHGSQLFLNDLNRKKFPAVVVFPQCPQDDYWSNADVDRSGPGVKFAFKNGGEPTKALDQVMNLLDSLKNKPFINQNRIYVGGLSMGGLGTYEILYRKPNTFAAAIAICGGAAPETASAYAKNTPLWIFHGALDDVVDPLYSVKMTEALLKAGAHPKMNLYDNANHNSWDQAFAEPELFTWIFSKSLNKPE
ncbi:prolyl oligopeptidase family serine peptidase [Flavimarina sp. Hel_I_48]|uniref:carboxylesterase family protein n=1 Tax=Flavimarina sp. Hel_I_48 TaxID=1392488 RepID=UPI0004DFC562|nr:prolyl oligopeptidase family serine peptidase [Flavimarina sp. Hel_I_48]